MNSKKSFLEKLKYEIWWEIVEEDPISNWNLSDSLKEEFSWFDDSTGYIKRHWKRYTVVLLSVVLVGLMGRWFFAPEGWPIIWVGDYNKKPVFVPTDYVAVVLILIAYVLGRHALRWVLIELEDRRIKRARN